MEEEDVSRVIQMRILELEDKLIDLIEISSKYFKVFSIFTGIHPSGSVWAIFGYLSQSIVGLFIY